MSGQDGASPPAASPGPASDQSMEDILASIRRILNEDEVGTSADPPPAAASGTVPVAAAVEEPFLLTEAMMVVQPDEQPPASLPAASEPEPAPAPEPAPEPAPTPSPARPPEVRLAEDALLAPAVAAAAAASVGQLLRAVSNERSAMVSRGGPSIEDVVREELRPLLKDWLDHHLPLIVERLVRAEIERVAGRA